MTTQKLSILTSGKIKRINDKNKVEIALTKLTNAAWIATDIIAWIAVWIAAENGANAAESAAWIAIGIATGIAMIKRHKK